MTGQSNFAEVWSAGHDHAFRFAGFETEEFIVEQRLAKDTDAAGPDAGATLNFAYHGPSGLQEGAHLDNCGTPFRLGMPHMDPSGVRFGWLLREACHIHWGVIADGLDVFPSAFLDTAGARVLPSVVACTVNGDATRFHEDDTCQLIMTEPPRAANGWRSQVDLVSDAGCSLRTEIVTAFARRAGPSNTDLERADLGPTFAPAKTGDVARRTALIRRLGAADRATAAQEQAPPHLSIEIDAGSHINGVGLVYFAEIHDMIARAEANAVPDLVPARHVRNRRVHFFGNLDAGDRLDIVTRTSAQAFFPNAAVVVRSHARRASDKAVIVVAESIYEL